MTALSNGLYFTFLSLRFEFGNFLKRKRILIAAVFAIIVPVLAKYVINIPDYDWPYPPIYKLNVHIEFAKRALTFSYFPVTILTAIFFASGSISDEFEKKTGLLLFSTPQRRISILTGKYLAALAAVLLIVSIVYTVVTAQIIWLYGTGSIPFALVKSYLLAALFSCSLVSIIYFLSSVFKKALTSAFIGLFFLFLGSYGLQMLMEKLEVDKWFLLTSHLGLISEVLNQSRIIPEGTIIEETQVSFGTGIAVMIVYAVIFFAAGTWIANRKDMK